MKSKYMVAIIVGVLLLSSCSDRQVAEAVLKAKIDSLSLRNEELKEALIQLKKEDTLVSEISGIQIDTLTGKFTEASLADCFHLSFKDQSGKVWNFDNPDNIYGMDLLDVKDQLKLKKGISSKTFKIWYANLKGIDCASSDSYYKPDKRNYIDMPTILKVEEVNIKP